MKKLITLMVLFLFSILRTTPVNAVEQIMGPNAIYKPITSMVTINDILSLYTSYGKVITVEIDGYTGNGATSGTYDLKIVANDGINDVATKDIQVNVVDSAVSPKIKVITDTGNIYVSNTSLIEHQEIIKSLAAVGIVYYDKSTTTPYLIKDTYTANFETAGYYQFQFRLIDLSGLDNTYQIIIYVSDVTQLLPPAINMGNQTGFDWSILILIGLAYLAYVIFSKAKKKASSMSKPY